jgi:hypothetical protein
MRILPFTLGLSRLGSFIVDYPWLYLPWGLPLTIRSIFILI